MLQKTNAMRIHYTGTGNQEIEYKTDLTSKPQDYGLDMFERMAL
jgi:hypothetical protein